MPGRNPGMAYQTLRLILGDQLTHTLPILEQGDPSTDIVLMAEVHSEATYVRHHKKKIALIFSAMRHFAEELREAGWTVLYFAYDGAQTVPDLFNAVKTARSIHDFTSVSVTEPAEFRLLEDIRQWSDRLECPVDILPDPRFLCDHATFQNWAKGRKQLRMEYFYREMRRTHDVLMSDGAPVGGKWNYDAENRRPPSDGLDVPPPFKASPDKITQEVLALVEDHFPEHFGDLHPFHFAVTRTDALAVLDHFLATRLPLFGTYQDAMVQDEPWMFHSHLSFYLNCGLLLPMECIRAAEVAYHRGTAPLNAVEGFIRQILGWREYVRGLYWLRMPGYASENALNAQRPLPAMYWGKPTQMNCMQQSIDQTRKWAYANHIQRLMVLGNFALLAGLSPKEVNEWYLIVYADAFEWVELPNVSGMVLFADGGLLASKPYAASGAYINRMSNYCTSCRYSPTRKNGPSACPFNYLYWDFLDRNAEGLSGNPRLSMPYRTLARMSEDKRQAIRDDAARFFKSLDKGEVV